MSVHSYCLMIRIRMHLRFFLSKQQLQAFRVNMHRLTVSVEMVPHGVLPGVRMVEEGGRAVVDFLSLARVPIRTSKRFDGELPV